MENTKKLKFDFNDLQVNNWIAALESAPASPKKMTVKEVLASKEMSLALAKARDRGLSNEAAAAALVIPPISTDLRSRTVMQPWPDAALG